MNNLTQTHRSSHLEDFFQSVDPSRGRLIFALDATASRQPTWDAAAELTGQMFATVAAIGGLDVQLVFYRGHQEFVPSRWLSDAKALTDAMTRVTCASGHTQIRKILAHARRAHTREKIGAVIIVSDACEEAPHGLYREARELGAPVFMFQENDEPSVTEIYTEIARITGGAVAKFDAGAAQRLGELLRAVAAFAAGGIKALAAQNSAAARLLLTQIKK